MNLIYAMLGVLGLFVAVAVRIRMIENQRAREEGWANTVSPTSGYGYDSVESNPYEDPVQQNLRIEERRVIEDARRRAALAQKKKRTLRDDHIEIVYKDNHKIWDCPHCSTDQKVTLTKKGKTSWSPRKCSNCKAHYQQDLKVGDTRYYILKKKPIKDWQRSRLQMLMDDD